MMSPSISSKYKSYRDITYLYSCYGDCSYLYSSLFFFQAEDGIRDLVRSRGLGDVYKRQVANHL